jgi:hypothetical protein
MNKKKKVDNGFIELKLLVRKRLMRYIAANTVVDMFSGNGKILERSYLDFDRIYAIEKNPDKSAQLELIKSNSQHCGLKIFRMNNQEFINCELPKIGNIDLLDFDAYGNPNMTIMKTFEKIRLEKTLAIAVTDGGRMNIVRGGKTRMESYFPCINGEGIKKDITIKFRCNTQKGYELLVMKFWERLSLSENFKITNRFFAWKRNRMVLYYGLIIEPN